MTKEILLRLHRMIRRLTGRQSETNPRTSDTTRLNGQNTRSRMARKIHLPTLSSVSELPQKMYR